MVEKVAPAIEMRDIPAGEVDIGLAPAG